MLDQIGRLMELYLGEPYLAIATIVAVLTLLVALNIIAAIVREVRRTP